MSKYVGYDIIVAHKTPLGARVGNYQFNNSGCVDWRPLAANNKLVFFGDIHQPQKLADNCYVIGAPMQFNFGDVGDRGMWVVDTDDWSVKFVELKSPKFITVDTIDGVDKNDKYNYYRVLHSDKRIESNNIVSVVVPEHFDERIKSDNFDGILNEWLTINEKDNNYLEVIKDILVDKSATVKTFIKDKLLSVGMTDFMSIKHAVYQVDNGFTLIVGDTDEFDSNGAGKTNSVDAICWCLFGETTKGLTGTDVILDKPVRQNDCHVTLVTDGYTIHRSHKRGLTILSEAKSCDLAEGLRKPDRQKLLEEQILGFDKNMFMSACYFSQENLVMLTGMGDKDKTNMITNLLGFDVYDDLYSKVHEKIKLFESDIDKNDDEGNSINNKIIIVKSKIDDCDEKIGEINADIKSYNEKISDYVAVVVSDTNTLNDLMNAPNDEESNFDNIIAVIDKCNNDISDKNNTIELLSNKLKDEGNRKFDLSKSMASISKEIDINNSNIDKLRLELDKLKSLKFGEKCDKCGSVIDESNVNMFKTEKIDKINTIETHNNDLNKEYNRLNDELSLIINSISSNEKEIRNCREIVDKDRKKISESNDEKNRIISSSKIRKNKIVDIQSGIDRMNITISEYKDRIVELTNRLDSTVKQKRVLDDDVAKYNKELNEIKSKIDKLNNGVSMLEFWKNAFSPKGIRVLLLDRFCNDFNLIANDYLSMISNGVMSVIINPKSTIKSGDERNKLSIDVSVNGQIRKYEALSGGEKKRVDISLCLALNKWTSVKYDIENGILGITIFDELFSFIDRIGEESIGAVLNVEGRNRAIFVISHTPELGSYANSRMTVIKRNGISSIGKE